MVDKYGTGGDTQYCYPGSDVLINKLGLTNQAALEAAEVELTQARIEQFKPDFDDISLSALRGIHRFLFQEFMSGLVSCGRSTSAKAVRASPT